MREAGIALVVIRGFSERQFQVSLSETALRRLGISAAEVVQQIAAQSRDIPLGVVETDQRDILLRYVDQRRTAESLEQLVIVATPEGGEVLLGDIAVVEDTFKVAEDKVMMNGKLLAGRVVNDSILLVVFLENARMEGLTSHEAAARASRARFRAVLLTSTTTIAGLLPLLFEKSLQARAVTDFAEKAKSVGVLSTANEDVRSLRELLIICLKGIAAYAEHAAVLGFCKNEIDDFMLEALASTTKDLTVDEMVTLVMQAGGMAVTTMALLDEANTMPEGKGERTCFACVDKLISTNSSNKRMQGSHVFSVRCNTKEAMMGRKLITIATLISITVVVSLLIIVFHQQTEHEVLSQYQQYQLVHAQHAARQIETYLGHISPTQTTLASTPVPNHNTIENVQTKNHALTYDKKLDAGYATAISGPWTGHKGNKDHSFLLNPVHDEAPGAASDSPGTDPAQANALMVLHNDVQNSADLKSQIAFVGTASDTADLAKILYRGLQSIDFGHNLYQYWIIASDGTLLFDSDHRNMERQNIYRSGKQCKQCHASFDYVEEIISRKEGVIDYSVAGTRKIAAFTPIAGENLSWTLVVESPYDVVSAFSQKSLQEHLALLGILVVLVFVGGLIIIRYHQQKIKAEEETKYWMEKRALEKKIGKSDELYRTVVDTAHDVIWIFDLQGHFIFINHSAAELTGYQPSDLVGKHYKTFVHRGDREIVQTVFAEILHGERKSLEVRAISKNGNLLLLSVNLIPLFEADQVTGIAAFGKDITQRRQAVKALSLERSILRGILDAMQYGAYIVDQQYQIEYVNPALAVEFGAIEGCTCYEYFHKKTEPCEWCKSKEVFSGKNVSWEYTYAKTGKIYSVFETSVRNDQGAVCKLSIFHDITQRKQAEKALKQDRDNLIKILDNMQHGVYIVSNDFEIEYVNPIIEKQFGPVNGRKCYFYFNEYQDVCPWCQLEKVLAKEIVRHERFTPTTGKTYDIIDTPIKNADGSVSKLSVMSDITETKKALEALQHSQDQLRLLSSHLLNVQDEERRRISREIHDELGQTLTVVKLRLRFLQNKLPERQNELNQECEATLQDIDHLIEDVRRLSRNLSPAILEQLGLKAATHSLLRNFSKHSGVKLSFEIGDIGYSLSKKACLSIYRVLQEALTNIDKHAGADNVFVFLGQKEDDIELTVEDDGKGFCVEILRSTEAKEKGLGLAIMEERARMLGGVFELWSREEIGTRLVFKVPAEKQETV